MYRQRELEFEMGTEASDHFSGDPLAVPTHGTHRITNSHYPPAETMTPIVSLLLTPLFNSPQGSSAVLRNPHSDRSRIQRLFKVRTLRPLLFITD